MGERATRNKVLFQRHTWKYYADEKGGKGALAACVTGHLTTTIMERLRMTASVVPEPDSPQGPRRPV